MTRKDKINKIISEDFEKYKEVFSNLANESMTSEQELRLVKDITRSILNEEKTFKLSPIHTVELPAPQTAGTFTQQKTYAEMEAWKIINTLENI